MFGRVLITPADEHATACLKDRYRTSWQTLHSIGAPRLSWHCLHESMDVGFSFTITSRSATGPWQLSHARPASR